MIKLDDAFVGGRTEVVLKSGGKDVTFYANELGFLEHQSIALQAEKGEKNILAALVTASVTDSDGNHFTYDEVLRLKKEFAEPLFRAVADLLGGDAEKN